MKWNSLLRPTATASLLLCSTLLYASHAYHPHQLEGIVGINHSSHSYSHLHLSDGNTQENDRLNSSGDNNDVTWGVAYAYNVLPLFSATHHVNPDSFVQHMLLGIDWMFLNTTNSGDVYQYNKETLNNFEYDFDIKTSRIMANIEVDFISAWKQVFPYVQASIGGARVETHYHDVANNPATGGGIALDTNTDYSFVYSLGLGIKYLVIPNFQISVSYLYTDFGTIETEDEILTDRFYTNSGLIGFTYLFG